MKNEYLRCLVQVLEYEELNLLPSYSIEFPNGNYPLWFHQIWESVQECTLIVDVLEFNYVWLGFGTLDINPVEIPGDKQVEPFQEMYRQIPLQYHTKLPRKN